jgi:GrpB-like predicted nucleotidyltransferase (UPF0157 family)
VPGVDRDELLRFKDASAPAGASPLVPGVEPDIGVVLVEHDPSWADRYAGLEHRVREALGFRVLAIEHVGSTAVPGLLAKPVVDIDLTVAEPDEEEAYVPPLAAAGFVLRIREPWWYGHRMLRASDPDANLHVFRLDSPEPLRNRLFRDWLRRDAADRNRYAAVKLEAAAAANAAGEHVMQYNQRKDAVIKAIHRHAFRAAGLAG